MKRVTSDAVYKALREAMPDLPEHPGTVVIHLKPGAVARIYLEMFGEDGLMESPEWAQMLSESTSIHTPDA